MNRLKIMMRLLATFPLASCSELADMADRLIAEDAKRGPSSGAPLPAWVKPGAFILFADKVSTQEVNRVDRVRGLALVGGFVRNAADFAKAWPYHGDGRPMDPSEFEETPGVEKDGGAS